MVLFEHNKGGNPLFCSVASYIDAWIEIDQRLKYGYSTKVASYIDAWIEISNIVPPGSICAASHLI